MKKIMLLFALTMSCLASFAGNMIIGGETKRVDTLMHRIIGPGVTYTKLSLPDYPLSAYLMTVNLANQYNKVETFQAQNRVGSTEAMTNAYQRLSGSRHNSLGSVNGNFWIVSGQGQPTELLGVSHSGSALDGQLLTDPNNWNSGRTSDQEVLKQEIGFAVIDEARKAWICDMGFDGKVLVGSQSFKISEVNRNRVTPGANEIVLFNQYLGKATRTSTAGTEVVVKLAGGQTWGVSKNVQCTVMSKNNTGGTVIAAGQAVLSGHGTGKTFLDNISVGQTITLNLGVYTLESGERPTVRQMVTGNAYVLRNGQLTIRNTNEAYNSQLYPRTGIGASEDGKKLFLIVIDKKGSSVGANTTTMCNILKAYGAYNVTSMDGGGSAQMMIGGAIVNNPSDGNERPVANGWMVFNTAPDDNVVASLLFEEHSDIIIPAYGEYRPNILAYNQYGTLLSENFQNYTLTCEPSGLGTISSDGKTFYAGSTTASGSLKATFGTISVSHPLKIVNGNIFLRLDSVLTDTRDYKIEVISTAGTKEMMIDPSKVQWNVGDENVCVVSNGILRGISNGRTKLYGQLNDFKDSLIVKVEIADHSGYVYEDMSDVAKWSITAQSNWNAVLNHDNLPATWQHGSAVNYTYQTSRSPSLKLTYGYPLYSLPDSMKIYMNTGAIQVTKLFIGMRANNETTIVQKTLENIPNNGDTELVVDLSEFFDLADFAVYPIRLEYLSNQIALSSQQTGTAYTYAIRDITLYYKGVPVGLNQAFVQQQLPVYPNPVKLGEPLYVSTAAFASDKVKAELVGLDGRVLYTETLPHNELMVVLSLPKVAEGIYFLKLSNATNSKTVKIVFKH